jgi:SGNH domain (fused to AT3 domains)/Acyltransferase family
LGVLAAHFSDRVTIRAAHLASRFGSLIAELMLIFLLVTVIMWPSYSTEHNMVWACVLTAAYLILTGSRDNVLNLGPLQFLGNISYSIYLLHWPLIVFYRYYIFREPTFTEKALLFCGSIVLATVSYRYIEEFFKRFGTVSLRTFLSWKGARAATIAVFFGPICGIVLYGLNGLPQRYSESQREQFAYFKRLDEDYKRTYQDEIFPGSHYAGEYPALRKSRVVCSYDNISRLRDAEVDARRVATLVECISTQRSNNENNYPSYLVIGDSNGLDAYRALNDAFPSRHFVMLMHSGCAPQDYRGCFPGLEEVVRRSMQGQRFDGVVLAARYSQQDVSQLEDTVKQLAALGGKVLIVGPSMVLRRNIDETYLAKKFDMTQSIVSLDFDANIFVYDSIGMAVGYVRLLRLFS